MKDRSVTPSRFLGTGWILLPAVLLAVVLQASLASRVEVRGVRPDWLLLIAVHLGLRSSRGEALLGAWMMGFLAELLTIERLGILSLPYALTAWCVGAIRGSLVRGSLRTEATVTLAAGLIVFGAWLLYRAFGQDLPVEWGRTLWRECVGRAAYSAIWALPLHLLLRLPTMMFALIGTVRPARR